MQQHHLSMIILRGVKVSRISYGIPIGGELEYVDGNTIAELSKGGLKFNVY